MAIIQAIEQALPTLFVSSLVIFFACLAIYVILITSMSYKK